MIRRRLLVIAVVACCLSPHSYVFAAGSGAIRVETPDAGPFGKGSAFVGEANRPSAVYYNPAGLTQIDHNEISLGASLITPLREHTGPSGDTTQIRRQTFLIPHFYAAVPLFSDKVVLGFGASSYWGTGTYWAEDSFSRYIATKSEIENKDTMITVAYKANEHWSFAVSADNDDSKASFKKKLFQGGIGDDGDSHIKVRDNAWGYRLAAMYKVNDQNQLGLMYRSPIRHKYRGELRLDHLNDNGTPFQTIFGGSSYETDILQKYVLPQSIIMGYSYKPARKWTFNFDLEWMDWASVKEDKISFETETDPTRLSVLNTGNPVARDWRAVFSQAAGVEYAVSDRLRLRGGYYHHFAPVPKANVDSALPDENTHGIATGFGYDLTKSLTLDLAYSGIIYETLKVDNNVGAGTGSSPKGKYEQYMHLVLFTLSYKF